MTEHKLDENKLYKLSVGIACEQLYICDWLYGNRSKSHIGGYEIIDLKISKHYSQPGIVSMRMKLTKKVDHSLCLRASLALVAAHRSSPPNNLAVWTCEVVSRMFSLGGGGGWTGGKTFQFKIVVGH